MFFFLILQEIKRIFNELMQKVGVRRIPGHPVPAKTLISCNMYTTDGLVSVTVFST